MQESKTDYTTLAPTYNDRYSVYGLDGIRLALLDLIKRDRPASVLETGCGTGYWLDILTDQVPRLCGLDYSTSMLRLAKKQNSRTLLTRANACVLPYASDVFNLVFCVNAIHHYGAPVEYIKDVKRILQLNGKIVVIGTDPHGDGEDWYVYRYFPEALERDLRRYPTWAALIEMLERYGFVEIKLEQVDESLRVFKGEDVFHDPFIKKTTTSQLAGICDDAYQAGLARIRQALHAAQSCGQTVAFQTHIPFYCLSATFRESS